MALVDKAAFRAAYFGYGRGQDGWTAEYWARVYEADRVPTMRYRVEPPDHPGQTRMMIVDDYAAREHRLFFVTQEAEDRLFSGLDS